MDRQQLIDNMLEQTRLARHAIRRSIEATRAYGDVTNMPHLVEEQSHNLQQFALDLI